jgi:hypothetical protein
MYIGRIITNMRKVDTVDFVENTNKVDSINDSVPTLIVGKELAESMYGKEKIHVLDKKISKNLYWTYSKTEKRNEFEADIEKFNKVVAERLKKSVKYTYINLYCEPISRIKGLIRFIRDDKRVKFVYANGKHIYIYFMGNVFGISMTQTRYLGIADKKIYDMVLSNSSNVAFSDDSFIRGRLRKMLNGNNIIVPYLYYLRSYS